MVENNSTSDYDYKKINYCCKSYQDYYQKLLVEDLIADHPVECHYGKCAVIGRMCFDVEFKQYYLESLRITGLPGSLQVPDGYYRIRVLTSLLRDTLHIGSTVEVLGEVVLWPTESEGQNLNNTLPKTSYDLCTELQNLQNITEERLGFPKADCVGIINNNMNPKVMKTIEMEMFRMREKYEVVLMPRFLVPISKAAEVININLELKAIRNMYENSLNKETT